jgi:hypothetical protein
MAGGALIGFAAMTIDVTYDFRSDAGGKDPDFASPTLRRYHGLLWSKSLPNGANFDLSGSTPGKYLHHESGLGEFILSSDGIIQTFINWKRLKALVGQLPDSENEAFMNLAYTIGGFLVWPRKKVAKTMTINGARGFNPEIADRIDLTLECVRRHYLHRGSPLTATLARYAEFFALFGDFRGYIDFFLLNDLVTVDYNVRFFMPFADFESPSVPRDLATYMEYRRRSIEFIEARNRRIQQFNL